MLKHGFPVHQKYTFKVSKANVFTTKTFHILNTIDYDGTSKYVTQSKYVGLL